MSGGRGKEEFVLGTSKTNYFNCRIENKGFFYISPVENWSSIELVKFSIS